MAIVLADVLKPDHVVLNLASTERESALREIIATMSNAAAVTLPEKFLAEVRAREASASTFVGNGVAFPHARTELVQEIVLGIGRSAAGVKFGESGELAH